jgi:dTDP-4-dehydrorhamnose reductase
VHFVIGGDGLVGMALRQELQRRHLAWQATSRKVGAFPSWPDPVFLDLAAIDWQYLPMITSGTIYLVGAMSKFVDCESNPLSWRVNVDAQIEIAQHYVQTGAFIVFISSEAVEKAGATAYGRQKAHVESYLRTVPAAIVRPSRISSEDVEDFAGMVVDIGVARKVGLTRWNGSFFDPWRSQKKVVDHSLAVQA